MTDEPNENHSDAANEGNDDNSANAFEGGLACNGCRRRKLRCSREVPTCQQCRKISSDCVYETKRVKPGLKPGAVEMLQRRLDALEKVIEQQGARATQDGTNSYDTAKNSVSPPASTSPYEILSLFARELQRFNEMAATSPDHQVVIGPRDETPPNRRRRVDPGSAAGINGSRTQVGLEIPPMPIGEALEAAMCSYFSHIHPWIPIIHEGRLRRRLLRPADNERLRVVLYAIMFSASRFIEDVEIASAWTLPYEQQMNARDWIVAEAMKSPSVESLQALVIVAFNDIGNGEGSLAWSLVGSMTRTVEYLQLTVEIDGADRPSLIQPWVSLPPPQDWTEAEERRRVFWSVFNLDRFCSVSMGWNTSLTSDDVSRRLPCDGFTWRKEDPVNTPYFGIWDKAAGRIGNPIAFFPSHYQASSESDKHSPSGPGASPGAQLRGTDMSAVGAFAYSVEATESLSRVNAYFLQQKVNIQDNRDLSNWLTRFKELDLRLVHWKMFLPQKWKANMARQTSRMDPNLTLAHITHNTSIILLHQVMAFPSPEWSFKDRLPSLLSLETCQAAAVEIATITQNYLKNAPPTAPVSSQFAFGIYIGAKVLLLYWRHAAAQSSALHTLAPEFWSLVRSLDEMARRWTGPHRQDCERLNLAAKYSRKLTQFHNRCLGDASYALSVLQYTAEIDQTPSPGRPASDARYQAGVGAFATASAVRRESHPAQPRPDFGLGDTVPVLPPTQTAPVMGFTTGPTGLLQAQSPISATGSGELGAISQIFMDQQFMNMDRVISYDDGVFQTEYEGLW
ncbi:fungal-specific transcription factor domain-containing protein [Verticillium dahliae]|nr:fungal-specific transcription factor domain-containing protein [Verticillium dahliae]